MIKTHYADLFRDHRALLRRADALGAKRRLLQPEQKLPIGHLRELGYQPEPRFGGIALPRRQRQRVHERLCVLEVGPERAFNPGVRPQYLDQR